jgi:SWI/SNF-related matrix-associated actin-dependent regulator of chromatin subfamily A member 5
LWHTITIDEGHRLKNEKSKLCESLSRLKVPFRLLLTGTPLQNNLHELWALLNYILPQVFDSSNQDAFDASCDLKAGQMNHRFVRNTRKLLETLMLRRIKAEVETSLLPKLEYVIKVPLTPLQRAWYQRMLATDSTRCRVVWCGMDNTISSMVYTL